ncbi:hypothetical protein VCR4J2_260036 [Vibrio coralliirubri]|nr:hypothetical protein VCR4J2_260036 [Vibrio coralliirubri]
MGWLLPNLGALHFNLLSRRDKASEDYLAYCSVRFPKVTTVRMVKFQ